MGRHSGGQLAASVCEWRQPGSSRLSKVAGGAGAEGAGGEQTAQRGHGVGGSRQGRALQVPLKEFTL